MSDGMQPEIREKSADIRQSQSPATGDARTAWLTGARSWTRLLVIATVPGIVMALLGPFGSFGAPIIDRLAYWVPTMATGAIIGAALAPVMASIGFLRSRPVMFLGVYASLITAAMSGVAWGVGRLVFGPGAVNLGPVFVFYVWMITLVMMAVAYLVSTRQQRIVTASAPVPQTPTVVPLALLSRLPVKYQSTPVLALQAEDHYVRVHTRDGSELILMRLSDAIAEMGTTPGARTHRSWWIAREAVKSVQRTDGRIVLELVSGIAVPVSRGYAAEIREAGWLGS